MSHSTGDRIRHGVVPAPVTSCTQLSQCTPFYITADARRLARVLQRRWDQRVQTFRRCVGAPWWHPGLVLTPELRGLYERYLPVADFCRDLVQLARAVLPHPSWIPQILRTRQVHTARYSSANGPMSLPDLLKILPPRFARPHIPAAESLPALLCAFADPQHFGTAPERYPTQLSRLVQHAATMADAAHHYRLLDIGCGVGYGTREAFRNIQQTGMHGAAAIGCTREPLEAWMATTQHFPHASEAVPETPRQPLEQRIHFVAADIRNLPVHGPFNAILCNGLIGGPFLDDPLDYANILQQWRQRLTADGLAFVANCFHDGRQTAVTAFVDAARKQGWHVEGSWHDLTLHPH